MRMLGAVIVISILIAVVPQASASSTTFVTAIQLKGEVAGNNLVLYVTPGTVATKGIRIYSEPSHTLLLKVVDMHYSATTAGRDWLAANPSQATVTSELPAGQAKVQVPARPSNDNRVAVWINGNYPDGTEADRLVSDGKIGTGSFAFTSSVDATGDPQCPNE